MSSPIYEHVATVTAHGVTEATYKLVGRTDNGRFVPYKGAEKLKTFTVVPKTAPAPTPTLAPITAAAPTCAGCRQTQTACRCTLPTPEDVNALTPLSIMNARATVPNPTALEPILNEYGYMVARKPASIPVQDTARPAPHVQAQAADAWHAYMMSAEQRALRTHEAQWEDLYSKCCSYQTCLVPDTQLRNCTAQHLAALYGQLQAGLTIREWRNEALEAWNPLSILPKRQP